MTINIEDALSFLIVCDLSDESIINRCPLLVVYNGVNSIKGSIIVDGVYLCLNLSILSWPA